MNRVAIVYDEAEPRLAFAAGKLAEALEGRGGAADHVPLRELARTGGRPRIVLASVVESEAQSAIEPAPAPPPQGYAIRNLSGGEAADIRVIGGDATGSMYGALDAAEAIAGGTALERLPGCDRRPHVANRGIKFNIPLDARTPSYSDSGDSAKHNIADMWDMEFWTEFLDDMALHRYNTLSLWNLHPFPSMVRVPEYPDIALADVMRTTAKVEGTLTGTLMSTPETLNRLETVKTMTIEEKIAFWNAVMRHAKDRGIEVHLITWNIFVYGTEGNRYGITDEQDNETTIDYFRCSVRSLLETYPLLAGIGVTAGEHMQQLPSPYSNEEWLWRTYGLGILDAKKKDPDRIVRFVHRAHQASFDTIEEAFRDYPDPFDYSYKYSLAHMYSSDRPPFIYRNDANLDLPGGYLDRLPAGKKTWLSVRDDDFYYLRWGDPGFVRQYVLNMPPEERLAGFYMGPDGIVWGRETADAEPGAPRLSFMKKRWYSFLLWGRLSYDPTLPDVQFERLLARRFPEAPSRVLFEAWTAASRIVPLVTVFHWAGNHFDFQWYPEACYSHPERAKGFHTVLHFIEDDPMPESGLIGIREYADRLLRGEPANGIAPPDVARDLQEYANRTIALLGRIGRAEDRELRRTLADLDAMAWLGNYYAAKILGAAELRQFQTTGDAAYRERAVERLREASAHWAEYADRMEKLYAPQYFTRLGRERVDIRALQAAVDRDVILAQQAEPIHTAVRNE